MRTLTILEYTIAIIATGIMIGLLLVMWLNMPEVNNPGVEISEPFVIERIEYLQGGFGHCPRTVITKNTGETVVINGTALAPKRGVKVVIQTHLGTKTLKEF